MVNYEDGQQPIYLKIFTKSIQISSDEDTMFKYEIKFTPQYVANMKNSKHKTLTSNDSNKKVKKCTQIIIVSVDDGGYFNLKNTNVKAKDVRNIKIILNTID